MLRKFFIYLFLLVSLVSAPLLQGNEVQIYLEEAKQSEGTWALIELNLEKGEHSYWLNPGEGGYAPSLSWELPDGVQVEELIWESPTPFTKLGQVSYGYSKKMRALAKLSFERIDSKSSGKLTLNYLICNDSACEPRSSDGSVDLITTISTAKDQRLIQEKFDAVRKNIPLENERLQATLSHDAFKVSIPHRKSVSKAWIIPYEQGIIDPKDQVRIESLDQQLTFSVPLSKKVEENLTGILLIEEHGKIKSWKITEASFIDQVSETSTSHTQMGLWMALVLAFFGGIILNFMPCVLPVLSLKILSFIEFSKKEKKAALRYGLLFTFGVLVSFWILGALLLLLRSYGDYVGWGFQLQHPMFVLSLLILFFLMGLSLFGLFEWGSSLNKLGKYQKLSKGSGVFLSGMFATLVATPCTGPLLGPALGLALTMAPPTSLALLSMIGLGLAFPYLICAIFPSALNFLPKPGAWLITFKQLMGFLMMTTVVWFVWVLQEQIASQHLLLELLLALLLIAFGAWCYGKSQFKKGRLFRKGISIALVLLGVFFAYDGVRGNDTSEPQWEAYSASRLEQALEEGRPVFVDFTAKWCLICQANKVVLDSDTVQATFKKHNVLTLRADWTKKDPEITKALAAFGRSGVPLYVLYQKGHEPKVFSQLLSQSNIVGEFKESYVY